MEKFHHSKASGQTYVTPLFKNKIQEPWKPTEDFQLIDLGVDYYIIKIKKKENMYKALGSLTGIFFLLLDGNQTLLPLKKRSHSAVWIRLPQLPTEFYDGKILEKIGNEIGWLRKIDVCTSTTLRGRYARLCVELPLEVPVQPFIYVGHHKQAIHYEGENFLCKNCGRLGHTAQQSSFINQRNSDSNNEDTTKELSIITNDREKEQWKTVSFSKRRHQGAKAPQKQPIANPIKRANGLGIYVKLFNAANGKNLDTQLLQYKSKELKNSTPSSHINNLQSSDFFAWGAKQFAYKK